MSNLTLMLIGLGVFTLLLIGLTLSAYEFLKASNRPDRAKGANIRAASARAAAQAKGESL